MVTPDSPTPAVSVVVPVRNEAGNIEPLVNEIAAALDGRWRFEVVYVNDGSSDPCARPGHEPRHPVHGVRAAEELPGHGEDREAEGKRREKRGRSPF